MRKLVPAALGTRAKNLQRQLLTAAALASALAWAPQAKAQAVLAPITGEVQSITIDNPPGDHWSGGTIVVGGTIVTIPRNLLIDLPANRLTLKELFEQAPQACQAAGQTGLAKTDKCNATGMGGIVAIAANHTASGNVIAGDVLLSKGIEVVTGKVTHIDYAEGSFRLNGDAASPATTGVKVRLNDPTGRHTVQTGVECLAGSQNCSADPRFTLDPDNYVSVFSSGYPLCIPSTVARPATTESAALGLGTPTAADAAGNGDTFCPQTNRSVSGLAADSRRFAPIKLGDTITAEGNIEIVNGVRFLSAHTTMVLSPITTSQAAGQPDYIFIDEAFIDMPGFYNQRARSLFIGFSTFQPADVLLWSIHYDPTTNTKHFFPLGTTRGCDNAAGAATCAAQGLAVNGTDIFRIRHDVDFLAGAKARLNPCAHLLADNRMGNGLCPAGGSAELNILEQVAILSPVPREIQFKTGRKWASEQTGATPLRSVDVKGADATNGQYLFPFGINLGGLDVSNAFEFNLNAVNTAFDFAGLPWANDRRLSPGGCFPAGACETSPQPLVPFPDAGVDPRTVVPNFPSGSYFDQNFTASLLSSVRDRMLSFVDGAIGKFNGDQTVLAFPPAPPQPFSIPPTPDDILVCSASSAAAQIPPVANADTATTPFNITVTIPVLANDGDANGDPLSVTSVTIPTNGTANVLGGVYISYTPNAGFGGNDTFSYTIADGRGGTASANVTVSVGTSLSVLSAGFDTVTSTWNVSGTSVVAGVTVTIHLGDTVAGTVVGTALVPPTGPWTFLQGGSLILPDATQRISLESTGGGTLLSVPITVR